MTTENFDSVWDAIEDTPQEAAQMKIKSDLMIALTELIKAQGWTQSQAANHLGVTQPRVSDLMRGKISLFGIESLIGMLAIAGLEIDVSIRKAA